MDVTSTLKIQLSKALDLLFGVKSETILLEKTNPNFVGDFTFVVFPYLKFSKKNPEQTAQRIGEWLEENAPNVASFNIVKGFLNIELTNDFWMEQFSLMVADSHFGNTSIGKGKKVMVEYSSPNTNKPLHLGHVRNNVLGFAVCNILSANGFEVYKTNLVNDRGIHICKSMLAWMRLGNGETPITSGIKGDHLVGKYYVAFDKAYKKELQELVAAGHTQEQAEQLSDWMNATRDLLVKWEQGHEETIALWKKMNTWVYSGFDSTYKRLGVNFDHIFYESNTYLLGKSLVQEGVEKEVFYTKEDGSVWVDLTKEGLDHKLLLRADGTSVYITQDMGTAQLKFEHFPMDQSIYVVGNEQEYHFKVLKLILQKLEKPYSNGIYHLSYGMVDLPEGKMKSREGTVVDADDLIDEMVNTAKLQTEELGKTEGMSPEDLLSLYEQLGLGALKYFLLKVDASKKMLFNPKESIDFQGNTGPFIQYTATRIQSIMRMAALHGSDEFFPSISYELILEERSLIKTLLDYPLRVIEAGQTLNPAVIANAVYDVAKSYNKFYHAAPILAAKNEDQKKFRIALNKQCFLAIKHAFNLLGISLPERM